MAKQTATILTHFILIDWDEGFRFQWFGIKFCQDGKHAFSVQVKSIHIKVGSVPNFIFMRVMK